MAAAVHDIIAALLDGDPLGTCDRPAGETSCHGRPCRPCEATHHALRLGMALDEALDVLDGKMR
jgi:hypothetical protein